MTHLLIVDDSPQDRERLSQLVGQLEGVTYEFATSGAEALRVLGRSPDTIDIVVTDLHIADMPGMELLDQLVSRYPLAPVMVVTSRSSVDTAVEALKRGAAYYVPKRIPSRAMQEAINKLISAARNRRWQANLMECIRSHRVEFRLTNDRRMIPVLWNMLGETIRALNVLPPGEIIRTGVAVQEALMNAIVHGLLEIDSSTREGDQPMFEQLVAERSAQEPYAARKITMTCEITRERLTIAIADEGPGFDPASIPDPTLPENLLRASGRGLLLMKHFMDEVVYNAHGNEVTLIKICRPGL